MTEDDTFLRLKKLSFSEIDDIWYRKYTGTARRDLEEFLNKYGWTTEEFIRKKFYLDCL
jgi:hypothetical protein